MTASNIDKIIKRYSKIALRESGAKSHYAAGVVDMAKAIKVIRDELQRDLTALWERRLGSPKEAKVTMSVLRSVIKHLDNIDEPSGIDAQ